jgi:ABC-type nitrate/sulfonate/bicarbonate transport system permease component
MAGIAPPSPSFVYRAGQLALRWSLVIALFVAWELLTRTRTFTPFMLPSPQSVLERIWRDGNSGDLFINMALTIYRALAGFLIAAVLGVSIGLVMTRNAGLRWFLDPVISVGFPMPKITFLPVIVLWLGFYDTAKISMVVFDAIFPILTATIAGVRSVEKELIWSARNLGARERDLLWQILLPAASPQILTGLQVALPIALIVAVVAEMMMGGYGMGGAMIQASRMADSRGVFAGIIEISIVGWLFVKAMAMVRARLLFWNAER